MAIIQCPECGKDVSDKAKSCPNCGCPINEDVQNTNDNDSSKRKTGSTLIILGILCWIGCFVVSMSTAEKSLADRTNYLMSGYHMYPELAIIDALVSIAGWVGLIMVVVGIVIRIVRRKKEHPENV